MITFKRVETFNRRTGKPDGFELHPDGIIDDFTGEVIDKEDLELRPPYALKFDYDDGCEQDWYYDNVEDLAAAIRKVMLEADQADEIEIDEHHLRWRLAEGDFHFSIDGSFEFDNSQAFVAEWMKAMTDRSPETTHVLADCGTLGHALRTWRKKIVIELLSQKKFTPEELGLIEV